MALYARTLLTRETTRARAYPPLPFSPVPSLRSAPRFSSRLRATIAHPPLHLSLSPARPFLSDASAVYTLVSRHFPISLTVATALCAP